MGGWGGLLGFFIAFAVVATVVIYVGYYIEQGRIKAYGQFCAMNGYQYVPDRPGQTLDPIVPFYDKGHGWRWRHEISGRYNGAAFTAFEYLYTVGGGRSQQTYKRAMIRWTGIPTSLPQFTLAPETFFTRVGDLLGWHDITFADDPTFNAAYLLKGENEMEVASFFSLQVRQQLVAIPGQHAAGAGSLLFWWRDGGLPAPDGFPAFLAAGDQVRAVLVA